jgi:hypothetical protein
MVLCTFTLVRVLNREATVKKRKVVEAWVVYKMHLAGELGPNAVCEQAEWDAMEQANPGRHRLVQSGILSEAEAERLARESPGGTAAKGATLRTR